jgi:hypothetical protein
MNPCPKCPSLGKCSGTCWLLDLHKTSESIEADMETPEYQSILEGTIPYINLLGMGRTEEQIYWAHKQLEEMF